MALVDILIVLLLVCAGVYAVGRKRQTDRREADRDLGDAGRMAEEVRELRARIHVLERALTDHHAGADLATEIERLRDR